MKSISIPRLVMAAERMNRVNQRNTWFWYQKRNDAWDVVTPYFFIRSRDDAILRAVQGRVEERHVERSETVSATIDSMLRKDQDQLRNTGIMVESKDATVRFMASDRYCVAINELYFSIFNIKNIFGHSAISPVILEGADFVAGIMPIRIGNQDWVKGLCEVADLCGRR